MSDEDAADVARERQVVAHNDYPIELWRDETCREQAAWGLLRQACADLATEQGRKLITGTFRYQEQRYWEFAREVKLEGDGYMLLPCDEAEANAVRLRLTCWTLPA